MSIAANRLSYWFDWTGPSMVVDTACSASLLSVHLASKSLRSGECRFAVAGGVNLILAPTTTVSFAQAGMMAPDGRCKTFDAAADGYVRGEGSGLVVLKRLSHAIEDGDRILALLLGSATNQDGRTNGLTAPKGVAQVAVIREALRAANLAPNQISYVEAHGTGTSLGDAVEVGALAEVLGEGRGPDEACVLSAAKSNIGHLESAAGIAGLIKVVLAMRNEVIPPVAHFRSRNPKISFGGVPFSIPTQLAAWPAGPGNRYAGLSSFSFGGSNVHVVLGEAPKRADAADPEAPPYILPLSAKSEWSLRRLASGMAEYLVCHPKIRPADACFTAACGRAHFPHRLAVVANSTAELADLLGRAAVGPLPPVPQNAARTSSPKLGFVFDDLPTLSLDGSRRFYETEPRLRKALEEPAEALRKITSRNFDQLLSSSEVEAQVMVQFALQYALARLLISLGIADWSAAGVGTGTWVAAALSKAATVEHAIRGAAGVRTSAAGVCVDLMDASRPSGTVPDLASGDGAAELLRQRGCEDLLWLGSVAALGERLPHGIPVDRRTGLLRAVASLYERGHSIDWHAWHSLGNARKISLPTYPFHRRRCWLEPQEIRPHMGVPKA
jgi:acyl transferase domain-containing protein